MTAIAVVVAKVAPVFEDAEIRSVILAATVTAGQALYLTSSGTYNLADANVTAAQQFRGIALEGGAAGQAISMIRRGEVAGFTFAGNHDDVIYLSDTAGGLDTATSVTLTVQVGRLVPMSDADYTKVLYVDADMIREWA